MFKIPENELVYEDLRSSGPGGQNVNKVATGQRVRWNFESSKSLSGGQKQMIRQKVASHYLTKDGEIIVKSVSERVQSINAKMAYDRLEQIVNDALRVPVERKPTKPTKASKERKLTEKKMISAKKKRRKGDYDYTL